MVLYSKGKLFYIIMEASYIHPDLEVRDPVGHPVGDLFLQLVEDSVEQRVEVPFKPFEPF